MKNDKAVQHSGLKCFKKHKNHIFCQSGYLVIDKNNKAIQAQWLNIFEKAKMWENQIQKKLKREKNAGRYMCTAVEQGFKVTKIDILRETFESQWLKRLKT